MDTDYVPSTWCVLHPSGRVDHQPGEATNTAIRKALGGYTGERITLDPAVDEHLHAWRSSTKTSSTESNYPARAILAGWLREAQGTPINGPVVLSGVDGNGIPSDVLERLTLLDARARAS